MKKIIIFLVIIIGLFAAIAVITKMQQNEKVEGNIYNKDDLNPATIDQLDDPLYQNIILPNDLNKKLKAKEDVTVYFFSPTCSYCQQTTPIVNPVAEDLDINLLQFNLLEFEHGFNDYNITHTPTLIHFKNGMEEARIVGAHPAEDFEAFFDENVK
ncbi:thioredoxin family protein [Lederbergia lenta]|uniref:Thioredoxin domain-containing protein n=1 Tax=Lederbergia lenta TaxID=1467 RepID=A0A2X4ZL31_LEDLE|nr:thioredoxin family protein [Lederbergia lenta]MCM3110559.1 thioredoxin family protein [Lederbergia lenta]MEC2323875.1 thioredoxin family protein [Lederbergia lenta]SQI61164.1 Thioredoxin domain-containing protein [Lederbergia lenta]